MTKTEAIKQIQKIQSGGGAKQSQFPEEMKGSMAVRAWKDEKFSYGFEYGVIFGLMLAHDITEADLVNIASEPRPLGKNSKTP